MFGVTQQNESFAILANQTVAVMDMVGYSTVARLLEENCGPGAVAHLNEQIQRMAQDSLSGLNLSGPHSVLAKTGDGVIVKFGSCEDAHLFAEQLFRLAAQHNDSKTEKTAMRSFRVGIAVGDLTRHTREQGVEEYAGITIANAVRLECAAHPGEIIISREMHELLPARLQEKYGPEETVYGKREETFAARRYRITPTTTGSCSNRKIYTRRFAVVGGGMLALTGLGTWGSRKLTSVLNHRLPAKRFVALVAWPIQTNSRGAVILEEVLQTIERELVRIESIDQNLLVIRHSMKDDVPGAKQFRDLSDTLGTNLIAAVSSTAITGGLQLSFSVLNSASGNILRTKSIQLSTDRETDFLQNAVSLAERLLDISAQPIAKVTKGPLTRSDNAYGLFLAADELMKDPNETDLNIAISKYKAAIEQDSGFALAYAKLAMAYFRYYMVSADSGALSLAFGNCDKALSLDPNLVAAHLARSSVLEQTGHPAEAYQELRTALAADPSNYRTLLYLAQMHTRSGHWQEAEEVFIRILKSRPNYWLAHNELGVVYNAQANYSMALKEFRAASLAAPNSSLAYNNIGAIYLQQGKLEDAVSNVKRSLELRSTDEANVTLAAIYRAKGDSRSAVDAATKATTIQPDEGANWLELADSIEVDAPNSQAALESYARAEKEEVESLKTNPTNGPGWMLVALCRAKLRRVDEANQAIRRADEATAADIDSQLILLRTLVLLGRSTEAAELMKRCIEKGVTNYQLSTLPDVKQFAKVSVSL